MRSRLQRWRSMHRRWNLIFLHALRLYATHVLGNVEATSKTKPCLHVRRSTGIQEGIQETPLAFPITDSSPANVDSPLPLGPEGGATSTLCMSQRRGEAFSHVQLNACELGFVCHCPRRLPTIPERPLSPPIQTWLHEASEVDARAIFCRPNLVDGFHGNQ